MKVSRPQTAVYWAPYLNDGFGNVTFSTPVEIAVRWEDRIELFVDNQGKEQKSRCVVYPESIVKLEGYLYLGLLNKLTVGEKADPKSLAAAIEIRGVSASTNIKGTQTLYKAWL